MKWIYCALLLLLVGNVYCSEPAVRVRITQKGLYYVMESAVTQAKEQLIKQSIPDVKGKVPLLGYSYSLTNVNITTIKISSMNLRSYPKYGLLADVRNVDFEVIGNWTLWTSFSGNFIAKIRRMSIKIITDMAADEGRLLVTDVRCASKLDYVTIDVEGSGRWIYQFLKNSIQTILKTKIPKIACEQAKTRIESFLNKKFTEFPVKRHLGNAVTLDYSVVKDPDFNRDFVDLFLKGEFQAQDSNVTWLHKPRAQPGDFRRSRMIYVTILDHMANSAGEAYYNQGVLNIEVSADQALGKRKGLFNVKAFKNIPTIVGFNVFRSVCPNCDLKIQMEAASAPKIGTGKSGINISVQGIARVKTDHQNRSNKIVLVLAMNITATATPKLNGTKLRTEISNLKITTKILKPTVDGPTPAKLKSVEILVRKEVENLLEKRLSVFEIPLPLSDKVKLVNPKISYGKHFITLATDIQYT